MELKQLEYFRAIVDAGTISGAARDLHMTQPPLSYQIKMLEEELQVPLFLRGKKRITLTEAGKTLYDKIQPVCHSAYRYDPFHRINDVRSSSSLCKEVSQSAF